MSNKQEILYGLGMIALALQIGAISTDHWSVASASKLNASLPQGVHGDAAVGLWRACGEVWGKSGNQSADANVCIHLPIDGLKSFPKNSLYAARTFSILGVLMIFGALMCMMYMQKYTRCQLMMLIGGGISCLIGMAIWGAELKKIKYDDSKPAIKMDFGYSYFLAMAAGFVALIAAFYHYRG